MEYSAKTECMLWYVSPETQFLNISVGVQNSIAFSVFTCQE
jgi:hypothetical protein